MTIYLSRNAAVPAKTGNSNRTFSQSSNVPSLHCRGAQSRWHVHQSCKIIKWGRLILLFKKKKKKDFVILFFISMIFLTDVLLLLEMVIRPAVQYPWILWCLCTLRNWDLTQWVEYHLYYFFTHSSHHINLCCVVFSIQVMTTTALFQRADVIAGQERSSSSRESFLLMY